MVFLCLSFSLTAQQYTYFVPFTDKDNTPYSVDNPEEFLSIRSVSRRDRQGINITASDLPPDPNYIFSVRSFENVQLRYSLRWLNGAVFEISDTSVLQEIRGYDFVIGEEVLLLSEVDNSGKKLKEKKRKKAKEKQELTDVGYGASADQIKQLSLDTLHFLGYRGRTITIAVLDAGYTGAKEIPGLSHLWDQERIVDERDFVTLDNELLYSGSEHGTMVLGVLAADLRGSAVGSAPEANYILLKTEDESSEYLIEPYNWIAGAEFADSAGADILNTSLGYTEFDNSDQNFDPEALTGDSITMTRAANMAADRGMLVVNSAGNLGNSSWGYISVPADGDRVLAVGGVNLDSTRLNFSGVGPETANKIKPDVAALGRNVKSPYFGTTETRGNNGTSFSAPLVSGGAACLWQAYRELTAHEVRDLIIRSGHTHHDPDREIGHGIPSFRDAYRELEIAEVDSILKVRDETFVYPNPAVNEITIISKIGGSFYVHDTGGNLIDSGYINRKYILDIQDYTPGIYILSIGEERIKFVRE